MTEADWLACSEPDRVLQHIRYNARDRKVRLFAVACCRHIRTSQPHHQLLEAIEAAEGYADGMATKAALKRARRGVRVVRHVLPTTPKGAAPEWVALWLAEVAASENAVGMVAHEIQRLASLGLLGEEERPGVPRILGCIFGNPFRPTTFDPAWVTPRLFELARSIYDDWAFDRMPALADALEDSGCHQADILGHCRGPGPHARGCWVIDMVLGKS